VSVTAFPETDGEGSDIMNELILDGSVTWWHYRRWWNEGGRIYLVKVGHSCMSLGALLVLVPPYMHFLSASWLPWWDELCSAVLSLPGWTRPSETVTPDK
jgi:hypothetical protein